jgi:hypothetical protein
MQHCVRVVLIAVPMALLAACTSSGSRSTNNPYTASIKQAARHATSDFERTVLSDGRITRAEYDEAVHRYVACADSHGVPMTAQLEAPTHAYYIYAVTNPSPADQTIMDSCAKGTTALIESLYTEMVMNPRRTNIFALIASCLVRKGVAPKSYTGSELKGDLDDQFVGAPFNPDSPGVQSRYGACIESPAQ